MSEINGTKRNRREEEEEDEKLEKESDKYIRYSSCKCKWKLY